MIEASINAVEDALSTQEAKASVAAATKYLINLQSKNKFNSARAVEVYSMTLDNIVWSYLKNRAKGRDVYLSYRASGANQEFGQQLTKIFTKDGMIADQRPVRKHFRWLLGA